MSASGERAPSGDALLRLAAGADPARLASLRARVAAGEPAPYAAGFLIFRGRRFAMDRRAYVTDPELTHLIDAVLDEGDALEARLGRAPRVLEFGVGAGTLALTLALERPGWLLSGLDVDATALDLARENARAHGVLLELICSNFLAAWPETATPPDLLYGDPPWGSATDLYDDERDETYYRHMPEHSVFPPGNSRTGIHDELLRQFAARRWPTVALLNYGVLPAEDIARSAAPVPHWTVSHPREGLSLLRACAAA